MTIFKHPEDDVSNCYTFCIHFSSVNYFTTPYKQFPLSKRIRSILLVTIRSLHKTILALFVRPGNSITGRCKKWRVNWNWKKWMSVYEILPAALYSSAATSKSGLHFNKVVFKLKIKNNNWEINPSSAFRTFDAPFLRFLYVSVRFLDLRHFALFLEKSSQIIAYSPIFRDPTSIGKLRRRREFGSEL